MDEQNKKQHLCLDEIICQFITQQIDRKCGLEVYKLIERTILPMKPQVWPLNT